MPVPLEGKCMFYRCINPQMNGIGIYEWVYLAQCGEKLGTQQRVNKA